MELKRGPGGESCPALFVLPSDRVKAMPSNSSDLLIIRDQNLHTRVLNFTIDFPASHPPEVYFDTNVWLSMSDADLESLQVHKAQRGYRYRYSITNYIEMLSRLGRGATPRFLNPFGRIRAAFRRIQRLCEPEVLPSPEMSFLEHVGLSHYLSPNWIPNPRQTAMAVNMIAHAEAIGDVTGIGVSTSASIQFPCWIVDPTHYTRLTDIDDASVTAIIQMLSECATRPITRDNIQSIVPWFQHLAKFSYCFGRAVDELVMRSSRQTNGIDFGKALPGVPDVYFRLI